MKSATGSGNSMDAPWAFQTKGAKWGDSCLPSAIELAKPMLDFAKGKKLDCLETG